MSDNMSMGRMHLFEIHDQAWFPAFLRDHVTDALQVILNLGNLYQPVVPRLRRALGESGTCQVVDLCSAAGGPWPWLQQTVQSDGRFSFDVWLTDKYPNVAACRRAAADSFSRLHFYAVPVHAAHVPAELSGFRTVFTSFHHFRPQEARSILQDAVHQQQGIGIFEAPGRHALTMLLLCLIPLTYMVLVPLMRPFRWSRVLWTYLLPIVPFVLFFDGIISCLRVYSPRELQELVGGLSANGYEWDIGVERGGFLHIPITYLIGYQRTR